MFETISSWLPSFRRNQATGPATYGPRQLSWRHPSIPPYPEDGFTKMPPPEAVEIPPAPPSPPTTAERRTDFLMERLPDQGSAEANAALRTRVLNIQERLALAKREYEAGLPRILGHRLDHPSQNILEHNNLTRALQNATPEEVAAFREHSQQTYGPVIEQNTELAQSLNPETLQHFENAGRELRARELAHIPPSYHDTFPLPIWHEIPPPTYGEHMTDELVTPERVAQLPESAFTRRTPESAAYWDSLSDDDEHLSAAVTESEALDHPPAPANPAVADLAEPAVEVPPSSSRWRLPGFNWLRRNPPAPIAAPHLEIPGGWRPEFDTPERPNLDLLRHDMPGSWRTEFDAPPPAIEHPPAEVARYDMPGSWRSEFDLPAEEALRHDMPGSWRPEFDAPAVAENKFVSAIKQGIADLVNRLHP